LNSNTRHRIFLLSPARVTGERARIVMREEATFELALRLRHSGVPLGEVFSFMSGLYFRGKWTYARRFHNPPSGLPGAFVITSSAGLILPETIVNRRDLAALGETPIDHLDARYAASLRQAAQTVHQSAGRECLFVLLGSIATAKYLRPLLDVLGDQLVFPMDFIGRGDLSRGGLLLRAAQSGRELVYQPVGPQPHHGPRPARLNPIK
jgi:hypothetical protein